jgi:hypothetical protein
VAEELRHLQQRRPALERRHGERMTERVYQRSFGNFLPDASALIEPFDQVLDLVVLESLANLLRFVPNVIMHARALRGPAPQRFRDG